ncbi:MAG: ATP-binding protein [Candidatus Wildermuthbacteria bacterium]|nr:ATP-binding protein [Candidatus Wildermuthbacteria bacterium]
MDTNWYVIAGPPSSGKTTLVSYLAKMGYPTIPEAARAVIDRELANGKTLREIRSNVLEFQHKILAERKILEAKVSADSITFLDSGTPCAAAYCKLAEIDSGFIFQSVYCRYKGIFLLDSLPFFENDYARMEDANTSARIGNLLYGVYSELGYPIIRVPVNPVAARAEFILNEVWHNTPKNSKQW